MGAMPALSRITVTTAEMAAGPLTPAPYSRSLLLAGYFGLGGAIAESIEIEMAFISSTCCSLMSPVRGLSNLSKHRMGSVQH